jgi:cytochrome c oxidase assembly factor 6
MFGFGSSSSSSSSSSSTTPVAGAAPNREERAACWTARDAYFTCLDQNGVIAAGDDKGPCQREKKGYEGSCSRSWVSPLLSSARWNRS